MLFVASTASANVWRLYIDNIEMNSDCTHTKDRRGDRVFIDNGEYYLRGEFGTYYVERSAGKYVFTSGPLAQWGEPMRNNRFRTLVFRYDDGSCVAVRTLRDCPEAMGADACR